MENSPPDPLITPKFLNDVARQSRELTTLSNMARNQADFRDYVLQLNTIWELLPENGKAQLRGMILNYKSEGNFRGAFAEVVSYWILKRYFDRVDFHPSVNGLTPDFLAIKGSEELYCETFCIGKDEVERSYDRYFFDFQKQLEGFSSKRKIFLQGAPRPNSKQNIRGLGDAVARYLRDVDLRNLTKEHVHTVQVDGAFVAFHVHEWSTDLTSI